MKAVELPVSDENPAQPPVTKGICAGEGHCDDNRNGPYPIILEACS